MLLCPPPFQVMGSILLAIHPTADCWGVPRDLPTFTPSSHFWEIATMHHSVICIFKVFLMCFAFLYTGVHLWLYHPLMWGCEWFLQLVSTSANFGTSRFQPPFHINNDTVEQCRYQHQSPGNSSGNYSPLQTQILYIYPLFPTFIFFYFCSKIIWLFYLFYCSNRITFTYLFYALFILYFLHVSTYLLL